MEVAQKPIRGGESTRHQTLKRAAHFWAQAQGYRMSAMEVSLPNSRYRADVAAYRPQKSGFGDTVVFECKQSRPDFLSDSRPLESSRQRLKEINARKGRLEAQLGVHHPSLRVADSLFPEFRSHDFSGLEHDALRRLSREAAVLERSIYGRSKFDRLVRYRCADSFYAVSYSGVFEVNELPHAWGLLLVDQESDACASSLPRLRIVRKAVHLEIGDEEKLAFLHRLAAVATRETNRREAIDPELIWDYRQKNITG